MTRLLSIFLAVIVSVLMIAGTAASHPLSPQQETWISLHLSIGPPIFVPHPSCPGTKGFIDHVSGIIAHNRRDFGDFNGNYSQDIAKTDPEMSACGFVSVREKACYGNPQDKPGLRRAPPNPPTNFQLR
jgi:hypothetical protein